MNQLIHCINCNKVHLKTPFDNLPDYERDRSTSSCESRETERNDFQDFLKDHRGHQLEDLKIIGDSFVSEKAYSEPVKVSYFKATNGRENFVIKKFRRRIDQPLEYELIRGNYSLKCLRLEIDAEAIRKQLEREIKPPFSPKQVAAFIQLFQRVVNGLDVSTLERISEESPHPLEIYYKMDDLSLMYLLRNCHTLFKGKDYDEIEAFIHRHKDDGVLLVKAIHRIEISEKKERKRREVSALAQVKKASTKI